MPKTLFIFLMYHKFRQ